MNTTTLREYIYTESAKVFDPPMTRQDVSSLIDIFLDGLAAGLSGKITDAEGEEDETNKVLLRSFGTFKVVKRRGRVYSVRGKEVKVGDRYTVVFKPGADLVRMLETINTENAVTTT